MATNTPITDAINEQRFRITRALGAMPYGGGCNFRFNDPTKETEFDFTKRIADNLEKLQSALSHHANESNQHEEELNRLRAEKQTVLNFFGLGAKQ